MRVKNGTVLCQMYLCWPQISGERQWGIYLKQNVVGVGGHRGYQPGHQGYVHGTSNTSLKWRQDCIVGTIHCPSPGFHPALQGVHTFDEAAVSPTSAFSPPLDLSPRAHRFGSEVGRNCKPVGDWLLKEKGGIQVSPSALTGHCDSRLATRLLGQSWVCFLPPSH